MYSAGGKLPESNRDDDSTLLGKLFQTVLGNVDSTGVSCILPGNILIHRGGILRLSGILLYFLENILILHWGILRPYGDNPFRLYWG